MHLYDNLLIDIKGLNIYFHQCNIMEPSGIFTYILRICIMAMTILVITCSHEYQNVLCIISNIYGRVTGLTQLVYGWSTCSQQ